MATAVLEPQMAQAETSTLLRDVSHDTEPARVPSNDLFGATGFLPAPEVERIANELRKRHRMPTGIDIAYVWKRKGGKSSGRETWGKCNLVSGLTKHFAGTDFVIWLAADHCRENALTRLELEALIYHELLHAETEVGDDGEIKPVIRGHDWEGFSEEVREYGLWKNDLELAAATFRQLELAV